MEHKYFPLFINMEQRRILLVGAGNIALRRARGLLEFGAVLTVTAPEIAPGFYELQDIYGTEQLYIKKQIFVPGSMDGFDLVLSATDEPDVDAAVYTECKEKKIPVNIASDQGMCDFHFPALIEHEDLVIGVSSGGNDHKKVRRISAKIREWLRKTEVDSIKK